jgi:hypothetical protein
MMVMIFFIMWDVSGNFLTLSETIFSAANTSTRGAKPYWAEPRSVPVSRTLRARMVEYFAKMRTNSRLKKSLHLLPIKSILDREYEYS